MNPVDERKRVLKALWLLDRGEFLAQYRRITGESAGFAAPMSLASMIARILERETAKGRFATNER